MEILFPTEDFPIDKLASVFNNTTNSYKFYWFLAILEEIKENDTDTISYECLTQRMISHVWYPLNYFKLSFGKSDGFKKIADYILAHVDIDNSANSPNIFEQIKIKLNYQDAKSISREVLKLIRWVPYRFIRPFFDNETTDLKDALVNERIRILAAESSIKTPHKCPYHFSTDGVIMNKGWRVFFMNNIGLLRAYIYWHLSKFIQSNNPNAIGVSEKLFKPVKRNLIESIASWKYFITLKPDLKCIYSGEVLSKDFSIDHFIPWSYTVHDKNWNLLPVKKEVNSSKGDRLPNLEVYLRSFLLLQFDFIQTIIEVARFDKLIEQYCILYNSDANELRQLSFENFQTKMDNSISPMVQIASNMGFHKNWVYTRR